MVNLAKIYRLDFTVDLYRPYSNVLEELDIAYKHYRVEHLNSSKGRTGLQVGTDNDKIIIYDKAAQKGLKTPLTRIERQLTGPKVPVKMFRELRESLPLILEGDLLSNVKLNQVDFVEESILSEKKIEKLHELKTLIKHEGFFQAKKKLTTEHNNFKRDYGNLFSLKPLEVQPSDLLKDGLTKYFQEVLQ